MGKNFQNGNPVWCSGADCCYYNNRVTTIMTKKHKKLKKLAMYNVGVQSL